MTKRKRLDMPPLVLGPVAHSLGYFWHVIQPAGSLDITAASEVFISPRRKERLYTVANGEKIILTTRRQIKERPPEADGVLRVNDDGNAQWLWHRAIEQFSEEVNKKGWDRIARDINASWQGQFNYRSEIYDSHGKLIQKGLRPPQIGGLHAIGAHW